MDTKTRTDTERQTITASEAAPAVVPGGYIGPGTVIETKENGFRVELPDGRIRAAQAAFVVPYVPVPGDVLVLAASAEGPCYAIGVLHGMGRTVLSLSGDVDLRAADGKLRIFGDNGVEIHAPTLDLHAGKLKIVASAAVQAFETLVQKVTGLFSHQARESHTVVDGASYTQAKSVSLVTEENVNINGKQVHLG